MKGRIEWNNFIVNDVKGKREKMKQEPSAAERSNRAAILDQCHEPTFNLLLKSKTEVLQMPSAIEVHLVQMLFYLVF